MNKASLFLRGSILICLLVTAFGIVAPVSAAQTLHVCKIGCTYSKIADAVAAAAAGDTITVGAGTYNEHNLTISKNLTIIGVGSHSVIVDAQSLGRGIVISSSTTVSIYGLTVTNGRVVDDSGGGIFNSGDLTLNDVILSNNATVKNASDYSEGGGIFTGEYDHLVMTNCQVLNNSAIYLGAGIYGYFGSDIRLTNVVVQGNTSSYQYATGGGIGINSGSPYPSTIVMDRVTLDSNHAPYDGGGLYVQAYASVTITNSTISNNTSDHAGGGFYLSDNSTITMTNDTITANHSGATSTGGGIYFSGSSTTANLTNLTIAVNYAQDGAGLYNQNSTVNLKNTILAGNVASISAADCEGSLNSLDYNLIQDGTGCTITGSTAHNLAFGTSPGLGSLAYNGGITRTMALLIGSPAINSGTNSGCTNTDQRGFPRPYGAACDMGAYEFGLYHPAYLPVIIH